jgi:hypothetical protein
MLIDAIKTHALEAAQSGDWQAVAATLQAVSVTAPARVCWAVESGAAATAAGGNHTELLTVLLGDVNGTMLFQRLSSGIGVEWAHPVTVPYLQSLVSAGKMTQQVMDALIQLSAPVSFPHAEVTAQQCQTAYQTDQLSAEWVALQNDGDINAAVAAGDRDGLKAALAAAIEAL